MLPNDDGGDRFVFGSVRYSRQLFRINSSRFCRTFLHESVVVVIF